MKRLILFAKCVGLLCLAFTGACAFLALGVVAATATGSLWMLYVGGGIGVGYELFFGSCIVAYAHQKSLGLNNHAPTL